MEFKEIEFKYDAKEIDINQFHIILQELQPTKYESISSYDDFFTNNSGDFIRYRYNETNQELTIKRKLCKYNNNERIEVNLQILPQDSSVIKTFVNLIGYNFNFRIFKDALIYWIDNVVICYYIVYNEKMEEMNRFIEIEANESMHFENELEAMNTIKLYETKLKNIGINPKKRLRKSLFELYRIV